MSALTRGGDGTRRPLASRAGGWTPYRPGIMSSWFPVVEWLPNYRRSWFGNDLRALVTALMVPQSLAYPAIAG